MEQRSKFPYAELQFEKQAAIIDRADVDELIQRARSGAITDVLVVSHGWNNDIAQAATLYTELAALLRTALDDNARHEPLRARKFALLAIHWPSKRFAEKSLIPGGAAAVGTPIRDNDVVEELESVQELFDSPELIADAKTYVPKLETSPAARDEFVEKLRGALSAGATDDEDDAPSQFGDLTGRQLLDRLSLPVLPTAPASRSGGAAANRAGSGPTGAAAGLSFSGIKAAALRALNLTTYYQMKARAGSTGIALNPVLRELRGAGVRLHLVGHSFGGRLVTAATMGGPGDPPLPVDSLVLLQAAFSHYGFAENYEPGKNGFFRRVMEQSMVTGPTVITHSRLDTAVGYAYPLASRLLKQGSSQLGDAGDRFGGIGRNGALSTPKTHDERLLPADAAYTLKAGEIHNLEADDVIRDHSDIRKAEVANAILSAVAAAPGG
jgi:pimeloyl-ACP methyl ester carboxylesterase